MTRPNGSKQLNEDVTSSTESSNDDRVYDGTISNLPPAMIRGEGDGNKVLLHSCCAPCSGAMIEEMRERGLQITVYFYNPNIHPVRLYLNVISRRKSICIVIAHGFVQS